MYSWEIKQLLELKKYLITSNEYIRICNTSPQIDYIKYNPYEDNFYIHTKDNYSFTFKLKKDRK